jgi:arginyl-tRNA synthetase
MFHSLTALVAVLLRKAFHRLDLPLDYARCTPSNRPELADLQCNGAMPAARTAGRNPREVAGEIVSTISSCSEFAEVTVADPGFINMRMAPEFLARLATEMADDDNLGILDDGHGRIAIVDFGGPNVAKPLHVGHLRSLVLGESLRRIMAAQGWKVTADAHLGDWGLQMGMLTAAIRRLDPALPWFAAGTEGPWPEDAPLTLDDLERLYPEAAAACAADPDLMAEARADTAALQGGDPGLKALWRALRALSLTAQEKDFAALGVWFDLLNGESDAHPLIAPMVEDLKMRGFAFEDAGALVMPIARNSDTKEMPPLLLAKSDGAALYATTDLATLADRAGRMDAARIVYVVDQRQALHFEQVFRAAEKAGLSGAAELRHIGFGTVNGPDGKPYKTRQGGVARLSDLLDEAVAKAFDRIKETGHGADLDDAARGDLARKVGIAAVKFADAVGDRLSGYVFDPERLVSFEGKTGPYLQYACVRIRSIVVKGLERGEAAGRLIPSARPELDLLLACLRFPDTVSDAAKQMQPGVLAEYAFALAQTFSRFYAECPVLGAAEASERASRLAMCRLVGMVLERSLDLLGIDVPERM